MFIDVHSHLDLCKNVDLVVENAKRENVLILTCGIDVESNRKALGLSEKYSDVKCCLGVYPTDALKMSEDDLKEEIKFIRAQKNKIVAIGEVGLDLKECSERTIEKQKNNLRKFVELSRDLNKPIVIHSRRAEEIAIDLLEEIGYKKIILHCFSGKKKLVQRIIDNGWFLTIPANVKSLEHFQNVIEMTPIEQLFGETDSPFLHPDKEKNNEPMNVIVSYEKIAEIKKLSLKEVEKKLEENYGKVFNL